MLIGDPYKFAVLFERVKYWNASLADNNGLFALCINGKLFPNEVINAVISVSAYDVRESLIDIPANEMIYDMNTEKSFKALYKLVFPDVDNDDDNDYRYLLATSDLTDIDNLVFAVEGRGKIKILAAKLEYDVAESTHIIDKSAITEVILEKEEINKIINQLEEMEQVFKNSENQ